MGSKRTPCQHGLLRPTLYQLCVPKCYREQLLSQYHNLLGHFSFQRLYPTMSVHYFWRTLCHDIKEFVKTCQTCQFSKIPTNKPKSPLRPLPVPTRPMEFMSFDHKRLTRVTNKGNTYVLAFICYIALFPIYIDYIYHTLDHILLTVDRDRLFVPLSNCHY